MIKSCIIVAALLCSSAAAAQVVADHQAQMDKIKMDWSGRRAGFGNVFVATFKLKNENPFDVKDVVVECSHQAPSGTDVGRRRETLYRLIKAGASTVAKDINMGFLHQQATRATCGVRDFVKAQP